MPRQALIIGAGPAGLTAAYELLERTDIRPIVLEATGDVGGISKTIVYHGNRMDIGGHRFFSKSDRVMQWWQRILPLQGHPARDDLALGRALPLSPLSDAPDPEVEDRVLLARIRRSRILYEGRFYDYPLRLSRSTLSSLGMARVVRIASSYAKARVRPIRPERSLEDFFVNRFGRELFETFFRDYTQKVWGVPCSQISPEWGGQRVKGLSVGRAVAHAARSLFSRDLSLEQRRTETSLIRHYLYPKFGPGQMWEEVARIVRERGGEIRLHREVVGFATEDRRVSHVVVRDPRTGATTSLESDLVFSTMPVKDLVRGLDHAPDEVREVAEGLPYRDFVTVGVLLRGTPPPAVRSSQGRLPLPDTWIYVQDPHVAAGRVQVFNNWSPYLVADPSTVWLGLEYFCTEGDELWLLPDAAMEERAVSDVASLGIAPRSDVLDVHVVRMRKTYPAYFGTYDRFDVIRDYLDRFDNLFLIGRNGMHRYNNQDHSMLAAMAAVDAVASGRTSKAEIWSVNAEDDYHEER